MRPGREARCDQAGHDVGEDDGILGVGQEALQLAASLPAASANAELTTSTVAGSRTMTVS